MAPDVASDVASDVEPGELNARVPPGAADGQRAGRRRPPSEREPQRADHRIRSPFRVDETPREERARLDILGEPRGEASRARRGVGGDFVIRGHRPREIVPVEKREEQRSARVDAAEVPGRCIRQPRQQRSSGTRRGFHRVRRQGVLGAVPPGRVQFVKPRECPDEIGADLPLRLRREPRQPPKSGIELLRRARPVQGLNARAPHRQRRAQPARTPPPAARDEVPAQGPRQRSGEFVGFRPDVPPERRPRKGARDERVARRGRPDSGAKGAEGGAVRPVRRLHDVEQTRVSPRPRRPRTKRRDSRGERVDDPGVRDDAPPSQGRRDQDREEVTQERRGRVVRLVVRAPSRPVVGLVVRVRDVVEDVAPLARAPGVGGGGVRHPGMGIVVEHPGVRPVQAGLDRAVIPHHLDGELPPSGGGGGGGFVFLLPGKAIPRPGSGGRRSDQGAQQTRRGGRGGGDTVGHLRVPPRQRATRATHGREPTRRLERRPGKPRVADDRGALADDALARREQSHARGATSRGDGGAEAPSNATENPAASADAAGLGVTVANVANVASRPRRIQLGGSPRELPKVTGDVSDERCERARRDVPVEIPPAPSPQETGERRGRERRRTRPFPFLGDGTVTPARRIRGEIHRRAFVAGVG
mmetsp:Transcript_8724/g.35707  ORF Transcript_8724/g.35707 Transcript_8724/m.35707 type:complete len:645 (-) Transcript_8724:3464-5398(-)